jgi:hypothetical protein
VGGEQSQHPTVAGVEGVGPAAVKEDRILVPGVFQGIGEDRQAFEGAADANAGHDSGSGSDWPDGSSGTRTRRSIERK